MSDVIDRQAAIQTALEFIVEYLGGAFDEDFQKMLMERMNALPSAQPEPDWDYSEETKQITLIVPEDVYDSAETIFLSVGYEGTFGIRGMVYSAQPSSSCAHENDQDLQSTCNKLATDCISRQAAIDIIEDALKHMGCVDMEDIRFIFGKLPSAQHELAQNLHNACADLISRQAAIDAVNKNRDPVFHDSVHYEDAVYDISKLPPAQPEKLYTKADYIMALHKEYGCSLTRAEEAHNKALEYLQEEMMMKGGKNERREREGLL